MLQHAPEKWTGTNTVQLSSRTSFVPLHRPIEPLSSRTSPLFFGNQQLQGGKATLECGICKDISWLVIISHSPGFEEIHYWVVPIWQLMPTLNSTMVLLWLAAYRDKPVYAFPLKWSYKFQIHFYAGCSIFQQRAWFHHTADLLFFFHSKTCSHLNKSFHQIFPGNWWWIQILGTTKRVSCRELLNVYKLIQICDIQKLRKTTFASFNFPCYKQFA